MLYKIHLLIAFLVFSLSTNPVFNQDLGYAKQIIDELTSPEYHGRGCVNKGDKKAARFIASQFQDIGLIPLNEEYLQPFTISVNTFPKSMEILANGKTLRPGIDYMVDAASPGLKGKYSPICISKEDILAPDKLLTAIQQANNNLLIINTIAYKGDAEQEKQYTDVCNFLKFNPSINLAGIAELTQQKLSWNAATFTFSRPYIRIQIDSSGFDTISKMEVSVNNEFLPAYQTQNVVGYIRGTSQPDSFIVFTAHYDHLGRMGSDTYFPGANDNASGIAMLLNLAKYFSKYPPSYSVVFIALGAEELGLLGAKHFTENPTIDLKKIKFLLNFDLAGTGDLGIQVVNGKVFANEFDVLSRINEKEGLLTQIKIRGEACISDHCMFYQKGVPCFYIYTLGGINAYHDLQDRYETLPLTEFVDYMKLITLFINELE